MANAFAKHPQWLRRRPRFWVVVILFMSILAIFAYRKYKFHGLPKAQAVILELRQEERRSRSWSTPHHVDIGLLRYTRFENGNFINCETPKYLGISRGEYSVGDRLAVIPAPDTCDDLEVLGKISRRDQG